MRLSYEDRKKIKEAIDKASRKRAYHAVDPTRGTTAKRSPSPPKVQKENRFPGIYSRRPKGASVTHTFVTDEKGVVEITLTHKENLIFQKLQSEPHRCFGLDALSLAADTTHATTKGYIKSIRKKLQGAGIHQLVVNTHGQGYSYRAQQEIEIELGERAA